MLYGTGWVIFSGNSTARFVVIAFALLVAIGLGYAKFVRERAGRAAAEAAGASGAAGAASGAVGAQLEPGAASDLEARVAALEERAAAAAAALGGEHGAR